MKGNKMTVQTLTANPPKNLTRFERLWNRLRAIDDGFNYDPQEQLYQSQKRLNQQVERLQARVRNLETREKEEI